MFSDVRDDSLSWSEFARLEPELATTVRSRFAAHEHHVLATVRPDGSPRMTGTNVMFDGDSLWVGSMPGSLRTADLRRDPRCALHSNPLNAKLPAGEGDVRLSAEARELDTATVTTLQSARQPDSDVVDGDYFELRPVEVEVVEVHGDEMVIRRWTPTSGVVTIRKR